MRATAETFKALADPTRLRILHLLTGGELCVCEIMKVLDVRQSKASRHLAVLRRVGLVTDRREGAWMYYSLAEPGSETQRWVVQWLQAAQAELPQAAADRRALKRLQSRGGLCGPLCAERRRKAPCGTAVVTD